VIRVNNQETFRFNAPGVTAPAWSIQRGGGNTRGFYAVDLQGDRSAAAQVASGDWSVIVGGQYNTASGHYSYVGGGSSNTASGWHSVVVSGYQDTVSGQYSVVGGGRNNTISGGNSVVGGGQGNTVSGNYSAIPGGYNLKLGNNSFGFSGQTLGTQTDLSASSNIAAFVDVDMWLYNVRNQASQLRLYEPSGSGTNFTAFRAQAQASDITYTLPDAAGSPGQVLSIQSVSGSNVTLQWGNASGAPTYIRKTSNQTVTSSTAYQNDNALVYSASANQVFEFEAYMFISGGNGGIKIRVNIPSGASMKLYAELKKDDQHHWVYGKLSSSTDEVAWTTIDNTWGYARIRGIITMGSSGGNVQIQWAQNSSNATGTTVEAGSYLKITPVQ
jgi:hypothetical protein